jgi:hypothetical protein
MNDYIKVLFINFACIFFIVAYGAYRCKNSSFVDPLTFSFVPSPLDKYFDGWGITHLVFNAVQAYYFPSLIWFIFILGVLWELVEYSMKDHPFYLSKCQYNLKTQKGEGWWYGRWQDIVMNVSGLFIGYKLRDVFPPKL